MSFSEASEAEPRSQSLRSVLESLTCRALRSAVESLVSNLEGPWK